VAIIADAAKVHRKTSNTNSKAAAANNKTVGKVEIIPVAKPAITFVPAPVLDFCTIAITGFVPKPV
jgi:hypothetical protein